MKIISFNINLFNQQKIDSILQYDADIYIIPEIACSSRI